MPDTLNVEQWLEKAGYEYHCFISWPHAKNKDLKDCARRVKTLVEQTLALSVPNPRVFLDETEIPGGAEWQETLRRALCKSVAMVAICASIYFHPSHKWCGLEWAAMDMLSQRRLVGEGVKAIIPIIVRIRDHDPLPEPVSKLQYFDFSSITIMGRNYYRTQEFRKKIIEIVNRIDEIALKIASRQINTECENFQFPLESAFSGYVAT